MNNSVTRRKIRLRTLCFGYRKSSRLFPVLAMTLLICIFWKLSKVISWVLMMPPPRFRQDLTHFRRSRNLKHYLDYIQILIEPSPLPCSTLEEIEVIILVASPPHRLNYRDAIRTTWGRHFPTYFILGLDGRNEDQLIDNNIEAEQNGDLVVFDFTDHYMNLVLKTGLMMKWTQLRCPQAHFLFKADDDIMVNPWVLKRVLKERGKDAYVLGYVYNNSFTQRNEDTKAFLPRWLCAEDVISQYAAGPSYLISGDYISSILKAATNVPIHNIEDIYYTYNVAKKALGYELRHDSRFSPRRIESDKACDFWNYAAIHSLSLPEISRIWSHIRGLGELQDKGYTVCGSDSHSKKKKTTIKTVLRHKERIPKKHNVQNKIQLPKSQVQTVLRHIKRIPKKQYVRIKKRFPKSHRQTVLRSIKRKPKKRKVRIKKRFRKSRRRTALRHIKRKPSASPKISDATNTTFHQANTSTNLVTLYSDKLLTSQL